MKQVKCPRCGSNNSRKAGRSRKGKWQEYRCKDCGRYFSDNPNPKNQGKKWLLKDNKVLIALWSWCPWDDLLHMFPDRTKSEIRNHARALGISRPKTSLIVRETKYYVWTEEEDKILKDFYSSHDFSWKKLAKKLPRKRNKQAVRNRANFLGIFQSSQVTGKWSKEDDKLLMQSYPWMSWECLLEIFPNKTELAVRKRARRIKIIREHNFVEKPEDLCCPSCGSKKIISKGECWLCKECKKSWQKIYAVSLESWLHDQYEPKPLYSGKPIVLGEKK